MIHWGIACGPRSEEFLPALLSYADYFTTSQKIRLLLGLNSSSNVSAVKSCLEGLELEYIKYELVETGVTENQPSLSHSCTLDVLYGMMPTSSLRIISDADICLLMPGWDTYLGNLSSEYIFTGVEYPTGLHHTKVFGYPTAFFLVIAPGFDEELSFRASLENLTVTEENKHIFPGNGIGEQLLLDTGHQIYTKWWKLPQLTFHPDQYINAISNGNTSIDLYLTPEGKPLITHFRKARRASTIDISAWYQRIKKAVELL